MVIKRSDRKRSFAIAELMLFRDPDEKFKKERKEKKLENARHGPIVKWTAGPSGRAAAD